MCSIAEYVEIYSIHKHRSSSLRRQFSFVFSRELIQMTYAIIRKSPSLILQERLAWTQGYNIQSGAWTLLTNTKWRYICDGMNLMYHWLTLSSLLQHTLNCITLGPSPRPAHDAPNRRPFCAEHHRKAGYQATKTARGVPNAIITCIWLPSVGLVVEVLHHINNYGPSVIVSWLYKLLI